MSETAATAEEPRPARWVGPRGMIKAVGSG